MTFFPEHIAPPRIVIAKTASSMWNYHLRLVIDGKLFYSGGALPALCGWHSAGIPASRSRRGDTRGTSPSCGVRAARRKRAHGASDYRLRWTSGRSSRRALNKKIAIWMKGEGDRALRIKRINHAIHPTRGLDVQDAQVGRHPRRAPADCWSVRSPGHRKVLGTGNTRAPCRWSCSPGRGNCYRRSPHGPRW